MKTYRENSRGFTLIEVTIVIAVLAVIAGFGMTVNLASLRSDAFLAEQAKIVTILERVRSRAMNNMHDTSHGFCYIEPNYVIFREKDGYCQDGISSNELIFADAHIASVSDLSSATGLPLVFDRLTGNTSGANITITDGSKSANIVINNEGRIDW
jgi:prepilin-type N-terminal cleavage/methylation domain-containing protein